MPAPKTGQAEISKPHVSSAETRQTNSPSASDFSARGEIDEAARANGGDLAEETRRLVGTGKRLASTWFDNRKSAASAKLHETADGLRKFGETFDAEPNLRAYIAAAADGLDDVSAELERHDMQGLVQSAEDYTRQRPLAVFGTAVVAGLLLSRVLRSGLLSDRARIERS